MQHHPVVPFVLQYVAFGDLLQHVLQFGCIEDVWVLTGTEAWEDEEEDFLLVVTLINAIIIVINKTDLNDTIMVKTLAFR